MVRAGSVPSGLLAAAALLLVPWALPAVWQGETARAGAAFVFASPDRWLAVAGLGVSLGTQPRRTAWAAWIAFAAGTALGVCAPHSAWWFGITNGPIFPFRHLLGPSACLLAGLVLAAAGRWRSRLLSPATCAATAALSLAAAINDPALGGPAFAAGAALASFAAALAASGLRRLAPERSAAIGERIAGSWLVAIGLLLGALRLVPAPAPTIELAPPVSEPVWSAPDVPGFAPPSRPGDAPFPGSPGRSGLPMGTN